MTKASTDYDQQFQTHVIPFSFQHSVTMDTGATGLTAAVDLLFMTPVALITSTDWTNAAITFQASFDNTNFADMYDKDGVEYSVTVTDTDASEWITLDPADFAGIKYLKLRSGTAGTAVAQTDARTLKLITRRVG